MHENTEILTREEVMDILKIDAPGDADENAAMEKMLLMARQDWSLSRVRCAVAYRL